MTPLSKITVQRCTDKGDPVITNYRVDDNQLEAVMKIINKKKA